MIGITGAIIPGPLTIFTISEVLKTNRFAGLKVVLGHIISEAVLIGIIFLGFHKLLGSEGVVRVVSFLGGIALIAMGGILFRNAPKMKLSDKKSETPFNKGLIFGGFVFSMASPGFIIWWATIGVATVVRALLFGIMGVLVLTLGHWLADIGWYWSISYAVDKGKSHLSDRVYQNIIKTLSVLLVALGMGFIVK